MSPKELIRKNFRSKVFERDGFVCKICGFKPKNIEDLDCHHIISRRKMPLDGYVPENGITLCSDRCRTDLDCHQKAEHFYVTGIPLSGFSPKELFDIINSSHEKAYFAAIKDLGLNEIIMEVKNNEQNICRDLNCPESYVTWNLACEISKIQDKKELIFIYGDGRALIG